MSVFSKLFKKKGLMIGAPVKGRAVNLSNVSDPTFSEEILGKGIAILPSDNKIYSPVDGKVDLMFDTGHACNLISSDGVEILIHVGLDTVSLKGEGFTVHKKSEDEVKKGDLLIEFDKALLEEKGFDTVVPVIICNTDSYKSVDVVTTDNVEPGEPVLEIIRE